MIALVVVGKPEEVKDRFKDVKVRGKSKKKLKALLGEL